MFPFKYAIYLYWNELFSEKQNNRKGHVKGKKCRDTDRIGEERLTGRFILSMLYECMKFSNNTN